MYTSWMGWYHYTFWTRSWKAPFSFKLSPFLFEFTHSPQEWHCNIVCASIGARNSIFPQGFKMVDKNRKGCLMINFFGQDNSVYNSGVKQLLTLYKTQICNYMNYSNIIHKMYCKCHKYSKLSNTWWSLTNVE